MTNADKLQKWLEEDKGVTSEVLATLNTNEIKELILEWHAFRGSAMATKLLELRELTWGEDIPSSTCPEYREHHESIKKILKAIDNLMMEVE